jgi:hypothetical protein
MFLLNVFFLEFRGVGRPRVFNGARAGKGGNNRRIKALLKALYGALKLF